MAARASTQAETPKLNPRMRQRLGSYWRKRIAAAIAQLESEARRMLELEAELDAFATRYYAAVGEAATRLAALEAQPAMPAPMAASASETSAERQTELKARYRSLAKEIHPDRAASVDGAAAAMADMHQLNAAYKRGDLAALLRLEAQLTLTRLNEIDFTATAAMEEAVADVARAARAYTESYRTLFASPLHELMLRAKAAQSEGWDWIATVASSIETSIEEKEYARTLEGFSAGDIANVT